MRTAKPQEKTPGNIYQLKLTLKGARPPIWRRVQVPENITLGKLHEVIQIAMGWTNSHLHQFTIDEIYYADPAQEVEDAENETRVRLNRIAPTEKSKFVYEYDFGDSWEHEILVEKILPPAPGVQYPICIKGVRACPPEDCGGVWGYADLLQTIADPKSEDHDEMLEWLGGEFDPEAFDPEEVNTELKRVRV